MKTEAWKGGPAILQKVVGIVEEMKQEVPGEISGICISTAGMVDTKEGSIFYSAPLIPNYAGTQFKKTLEEMFQVPCEVENDSIFYCSSTNINAYILIHLAIPVHIFMTSLFCDIYYI